MQTVLVFCDLYHGIGFQRHRPVGGDCQETLGKLRQLHPEADLAYDLVQQFAQMLRSRRGEHLDVWLAQVAIGANHEHE